MRKVDSLISRILCLLLVVVALQGSVLTGSIREKCVSSLVSPSADASDAADHEQKAPAVIRAAGFEAIVSLLHFDLTHAGYFLLAFLFPVRLRLVTHRAAFPRVILSYFTNTFGHLIAINAP